MAEQADTVAAEAVELTEEQQAEAKRVAKQLELDDDGRAAELERTRGAVAEAREAELKAAAEKAAKDRAAIADATHRARVAERHADAGFAKQGKGYKAPTIGDATPGKDAEHAVKEGTLARSDERVSVLDAAPGKSLDDVIDRIAARARGEFGDTPVQPLPPQHFIVTDEPDLIVVAAKLGLPDHAQLGALNGRHNSVYGVQPGEHVILPAEYRFDGVEGVVTAGEVVPEGEPA